MLRLYLRLKVDYFILGSKVLFLVTLHCSMALYNNLLRNTVKSLWNNNKDLSAKVDAGMVIGLVIITNLVTYFISDVLKIINIIGGICTVIICYFAPILCWMKVNDLPKYHCKNIGAIILLVIVTILGLISAGYSVYIDIKGEE